MSYSEFIEMFKARAPVLVPILLVAGLFFFLLSVFIAAVVGIKWRGSKLNRQYVQVARQAGWTYSAKIPDEIKPYTEVIDRELRPETVNFRLAECFLSGTNGGDAFATFNLFITLRPRGSRYSRLRRTEYYKGALFIRGDMNLPQFSLEKKLTTQDSADNGLGVYNFAAPKPETEAHLFTPEFSSQLEANGIYAAFGHANMLCVLVQRDPWESPDVNKIKALLETAWQTSDVLKKAVCRRPNPG